MSLKVTITPYTLQPDRELKRPSVEDERSQKIHLFAQNKLKAKDSSEYFNLEFLANLNRIAFFEGENILDQIKKIFDKCYVTTVCGFVDQADYQILAQGNEIFKAASMQDHAVLSYQSIAKPSETCEVHLFPIDPQLDDLSKMQQFAQLNNLLPSFQFRCLTDFTYRFNSWFLHQMKRSKAQIVGDDITFFLCHCVYVPVQNFDDFCKLADQLIAIGYDFGSCYPIEDDYQKFCKFYARVQQINQEELRLRDRESQNMGAQPVDKSKDNSLDVFDEDLFLVYMREINEQTPRLEGLFPEDLFGFIKKMREMGTALVRDKNDLEQIVQRCKKLGYTFILEPNETEFFDAGLIYLTPSQPIVELVESDNPLIDQFCEEFSKFVSEHEEALDGTTYIDFLKSSNMEKFPGLINTYADACRYFNELVKYGMEFARSVPSIKDFHNAGLFLK